MGPIQLHGFNNLTKHLSFNLYDVCFAETKQQIDEYIEYIDEEYNAERLTQLLTDCTEMIGATLLNTARQDYVPQGASVTMLIAEGPVDGAPETLPAGQPESAMAHNVGVLVGDKTSSSVVGHLDKSHICVHTYPEVHPQGGIATFRADIEISTCGKISPLETLNFLIREFDSDVLNIDYRVRGFTRDTDGRKIWIDHPISSIQNYIEPDILKKYQAVDVNVYQENLFHTKLMWKDVDLARYLSGGQIACDELDPDRRRGIEQRLSDEILEIFYSRNMS